MSLLRIRVARETPITGEFEWARYDDRGALLANGASNLQAPVPEISGACELVVAAELVLLERIATQAAQHQRLSAALRYLVEDHAAADPEHLHVAAETVPRKDSLGVGVIDRQWFAQTLARSRLAGLSPRAAYPETLLVPLAPRSWTVVWTGADGFARCGDLEGFALDHGTAGEAPVALTLALDKARSASGKSAPAKIIVRTSADCDATPPDVARWSAALDVEVETGPPWHWHETRGTQRRPRLELLQGEFAPRGAGEDWVARLRRPAFLAAALLAVLSVGIAADWNAKAREREVLLSEMRAIYRDSFGERAVVVDAPAQMRRAAADMRARTGQIGPSDFVVLVHVLGDRLLDPASQRLEGIDYEKGVLSVTLRPLDPARSGTLLEALRAKIPDTGLDVRAETLGSGSAQRIRLTARAGRSR